MTIKPALSIGVFCLSLPLLTHGQTFTIEDVKERASGMDQKRAEVIERLSESISQIKMRDVSVIHAESAKVKQSDLGLDDLHGHFRIKLQDVESKASTEH